MKLPLPSFLLPPFSPPSLSFYPTISVVHFLLLGRVFRRKITTLPEWQSFHARLQLLSALFLRRVVT